MRAPTIKEKDVQRGIVDLLKALGFTVKQTQVHGWQGGASGRRGTGIDKGLPDLMVTHEKWPAGAWLGLEVKGPKTPLSPEQTTLLNAGRIFVVRSERDVAEVFLVCESQWLPLTMTQKRYFEGLVK